MKGRLLRGALFEVQELGRSLRVERLSTGVTVACCRRLTLLPIVPGLGCSANEIGPELGVGAYLRRRHPGLRVTLVKVAAGGTPIERWLPQRQLHFDHLVTAVRRVRGELPATARLVGLLWMQGESEALSGNATQYKARFAQFTSALRAALAEPTLPIVAGLISIRDRSTSGTLGPTFKIAQALALMTIRNELQSQATAVVETDDLTTSDWLHLDTASLLTLGERLAQQLYQYL